MPNYRDRISVWRVWYLVEREFFVQTPPKWTHAVQEIAEGDNSARQEADTEGIVSELATVFDPACKFHVKNQDEPLPKFVEEYYKEGSGEGVDRHHWAAPTASSTDRLVSSDDDDLHLEHNDTVDLTLDATLQHEWLAFLFSYFAHQGGLQAMTQVRVKKPPIRQITSASYLAQPVHHPEVTSVLKELPEAI